MSDTKKIWIVGPGALGLYFAAAFSKQQSATLISQAEQPRDFSIKVSGFENFPSKAVKIIPWTHTSSIQKPDCTIVAVKAYDLRETLNRLTTFSCPIVVVSNGLHLDTEFAAGMPQPLRAYCYFGARKISEIEVQLSGTPRIELENGHTYSQDLLTLFQNSKIPTSIVRDNKVAEWNKALVNLIVNSIATLSKSENGIVLAPGSKPLVASLYEEIQTVAKAEGVSLLPLNDALEGIKSFSANRNSLLTDIESKRETEIEFIQGRFLQIAKKHGISVPKSTELYQRLKDMIAQSIGFTS